MGRLYAQICAWEKESLKERIDTCALAFVFLIVNVALTQKVVDSKMGFHQWNITTHDLAEQNRVRLLHLFRAVLAVADFTSVDQLRGHGLSIKPWTYKDFDRPSYHENFLPAKGRSLYVFHGTLLQSSFLRQSQQHVQTLLQSTNTD